MIAMDGAAVGGGSNGSAERSGGSEVEAKPDGVAAAVEANRRFWNERVPTHVGSAFYDADGFRGGASTLMPLEVREVGCVRGKRLLHLCCQFGLDTLSWARLGAEVTGVDLSDAAIEAARALSAETGVPGRFVRSDVLALDGVLDERFDVVAATYGVVWYMPDLARFAEVVAGRLERGGVFYLADVHPAALAFARDRSDTELRVAHPYSMHAQGPAPMIEEVDDQTFTGDDRTFAANRAYMWNHGLGEVVSALCAAGLRLEFLREHPLGCYRIFPFMHRDEDGWYRLEQGGESVPLLYSLRAVRA